MSNFVNNKTTFFEYLCSKDDNMNENSEDDDMGKRILTFGKDDREDVNKNLSLSTCSDSSISSGEFLDIPSNPEDESLNHEIQEICNKDTNIIMDSYYSPNNLNSNDWEFAYKILTRLKLKEHWVKTNWKWDETGVELSSDFTNTLNSAIVYSLVTLINPTNMLPQIYKVVCVVPKKEAINMYKLNLTVPSYDWVLRSKWSWLSCIPYDDTINNKKEATV